jgi:hypothetical protein
VLHSNKPESVCARVLTLSSHAVKCFSKAIIFGWPAASRSCIPPMNSDAYIPAWTGSSLGSSDSRPNRGSRGLLMLGPRYTQRTRAIPRHIPQLLKENGAKYRWCPRTVARQTYCFSVCPARVAIPTDVIHGPHFIANHRAFQSPACAIERCTKSKRPTECCGTMAGREACRRHA